MAKDTLNQVPADWQVEYKKMINRIEHLELLIMILKEDGLKLTEKLPVKLANQIIRRHAELVRAYQNFNYALRKIDDVYKQNASDVLAIKDNLTKGEN